jgi:CheY-like chemotaxis protein
LGIFEMLRLTPRIKRLISHKASEPELNKAAVAAGTRLLLDEAMDKVKQGLTTVEEVLRVIQLREEEAALCPNCCRSISLDFTVCPFCSFTVRRMCAGCRQELAAEWQVCPYCSTLAVPTVHRPVPVPAPEALPQLSPVVTPEVVKPSATVMRPRILVVDDDAVSRRLAVKALEKLDVQPEITEASSGPEALAAVEKNPPDLVVLDIMMPDMSGIEVCRQIRSNLQTVFIPILMLTANTDQDTRTEGFLAGTDDYVGKPFSIAELHARIKRLLRRTYGL